MNEQEVLERIRRAADDNATSLDLSHNKLTSLPAQIGQVTSLTSLDLSHNKLTSLPAQIGQVTNLTSLDLTVNQLTSLPPEIVQLTNLKVLGLNYSKLTSLPPEIGQLTNLTSLDLGGNQLTSLPAEIGQLTNLTSLYLGGNQLTSLPAEIVQLTNLTMLDLSVNQLTSLPAEIGQLTNLTSLYLYGNQLTSLPAQIGQLTNLTRPDLDGNQLTSLPAQIGQLTNLTQLDLRGNQLPIPPEIVANTDSPQDILDYLRRVTIAATQPLNEAKLLVVGEASVGKTSLIKRLLGQAFDPHEDMTAGIERHEWKIGSGDDAIRLNVWDFGGQEIMHATHQFFLTKRSLYVLVMDSRQDEQQSRLGYWLRIIESFGEDSPVIIVCNKCDQQQADLAWSGLRAKYPHIRGFATAVPCEKPPQGIAELRATIEREIGLLEHVGDPFPASWFAIKGQLENMQQSHLAYEDYSELCRLQGVEDETEQRRLVGFLHDLGTVLHFHDHPVLQDENILNPEWVTNGVYCIVTRDELKGKGVLDFQTLSRLLPKQQYPQPRQRLFIVEMMRRFELCFEFEDEANKRYLIPGLLPNEAPPQLGDWSDSLKFQYRYEVLPSSVISRFIVRMHSLIAEETYWRTGVVLASQDGGNRALVEADLEDGVVSISITGDGNARRRLLDVVRAGFHGIHTTIPGIRAQEFVPLPEHPTVIVPYDRLVQLEKLGQDQDFVDIDGTLTPIPIKPLLDGVSVPANRYPTASTPYKNAVDTDEFDIFLAHNTVEKPEVESIANQLRERGLNPWLDKDQIPPGRWFQDVIQDALRHTKSIGVCVGSSGMGRFQVLELRTAVSQCLERNIPVIPVLLPGTSELPAELLFLKELNWVKFHSVKDAEALTSLVWGITGKKS